MGGYGVGEGWDECGSLIRRERQGGGHDLWYQGVILG